MEQVFAVSNDAAYQRPFWPNDITAISLPKDPKLLPWSIVNT